MSEPIESMEDYRQRLLKDIEAKENGTKLLQDSTLPLHNKPLLFGTVAQLMDEPEEETKWLIESFLTTAGLCAISGSPASGKTWVILLIAIAVSEGRPLFGIFKTRQTNVLIIDEEGGRRRLRSRFKSLGYPGSDSIHFITKEGFKVTYDKHRKQVIDYCQKLEIKLVILDSLVRMHTAKENDSTEMNRVYEALKQFDKAGIAVIFTHHHRKQLGSDGNANMRGSSDILAWVDTHFAITKKDQEHSVSQAKARDEEELFPFTLVRSSEANGLVAFIYSGHVEEKQDKKYFAKQNIVNFLTEVGDRLNQSSIFLKFKSHKLDIAERTINEALNEMVRDGDLLMDRGQYNTCWYSLPPSISDPSLFNVEEEL